MTEKPKRKAKKKPVRVIVSINDGVLYVNRVKTIEDQLDTGNRVYHCDKHLGKVESLAALSRLLQRLGAIVEPR